MFSLIPKTRRCLICFLSVLAVFACVQAAIAQGSVLSRVAIGQGATRYATNDLLFVTIVLSNYGNDARTDVVINYAMTNAAGKTVYTENETVAVQTTASFLRSIQIPNNLPNGEYTLTSSITYPGQVAPATSSFRFKVETKFAGFFVSDLMIYAVAVLMLAVIAALIGRHYARRRVSRNSPLEYPQITPRERTFYEITSDIIAQMRAQIGIRALELAGEIQGLTIDKRTGRIIKMTKDPAEVIAILIYRYEKFLGKKIIATPKPVGKNLTAILRPVNQNLSIIEKYFKSNQQ